MKRTRIWAIGLAVTLAWVNPAASEIRRLSGKLRDFAESDRGFGCYTDDT